MPTHPGKPLTLRREDLLTYDWERAGWSWSLFRHVDSFLLPHESGLGLQAAVFTALDPGRESITTSLHSTLESPSKFQSRNLIGSLGLVLVTRPTTAMGGGSCSLAHLGSQAYSTLRPGRQGLFVEAWGLRRLILRKQLPLHFSPPSW